MERWEETSNFIGTLAMALSPYGITIYGETLHKLLQNRGLPDGQSVDIAHVIAAASQYWAHHDPAMQQAIASAFLGPDGASLVDVTPACALG